MLDDARALAIVEDALDFEDEAARLRFVTTSCGQDARLAARVAQLLDWDTRAAASINTDAMARVAAASLPVPDHFGPWRRGAELGQGGMGAVYRATRDDGLFDQQVAIKLLHAEIATPAARQRFDDERRILARLNHPAIARIIDGGDVDGRPWLAMDFIAGQPITTALAGADLPTRLAMVRAVCEAVAHAHRAQVIHADIKPSNVLIDGEGQPHLLDFGIARLLGTAGTDAAQPMTRAFAAPEVAAGALPGVASDVDGLGLLLRACVGGHADGTDLAAIIARATAAEPEQRYPDVPVLLDDLDRFRQMRPVRARGDGNRGYAARLFVRRNWRALAAGMAVVAALSGATVWSVVSAGRAEAARIEAVARFNDVRRFARFTLGDGLDRLSDAPGTVAARAALAAQAAQYLDRLAATPAAPVALRIETAHGLRRLAELQGGSGMASLGDRAAARRSLAKARQLLTVVLAGQHGNAAALTELGWVQLVEWTLLPNSSISGRTNRQAATLFRQALAAAPATPEAQLGLLVTDKNRAFDLIYDAARPAQAVPVLDMALGRLQAPAMQSIDQRRLRLLAVSMTNLRGDARFYAGSPATALRGYRAAADMVAAELARGSSAVWIDRYGEAMYNIGSTLLELPGSRTPALAALQKGINLLEGALAYGQDFGIKRRLTTLYLYRGEALARSGQAVAALADATRAVALRRQILAQSPQDPGATRDLAIALTTQASMAAAAGQTVAACEAARAADQLYEHMRRRGEITAFDEQHEAATARTAVASACAAVRPSNGSGRLPRSGGPGVR